MLLIRALLEGFRGDILSVSERSKPSSEERPPKKKKKLTSYVVYKILQANLALGHRVACVVLVDDPPYAQLFQAALGQLVRTVVFLPLHVDWTACMRRQRSVSAGMQINIVYSSISCQFERPQKGKHSDYLPVTS